MSDINSVISAVGAGAGSAQAAIGLFDQIFSGLENIRTRKLTAENCLRAYYIEVLNNIEIFSILDLTKLRAVRVNSAQLRFVLANLHTEIGSAILFTDELDEQSNLYKFLKDQGRVRNKGRMMIRTENGRDVAVTGASFYENILQAVSFTVVKTEILRRMSRFTDEDLGLVRDVRIEKRLTNISERYQMIKEKMEAFPGIREIAR